ncbi:MAG: phytoene/squalene synthase family protein [bacterium]|nr:phytoene/squalene synthase family protein [bacterium]
MSTVIPIPSPHADLRASYAWCEKLTKERAKNFYYGLSLLPEPRRLAACAFYAFCRDCDDISDDEAGQDSAQRLEQWKLRLDDDTSPEAWPGILALRHTLEKYAIPRRYLYELIEGTAMDVQPCDYRTFQDTYNYCYHVASTVGLVCVHIFGFSEADQKEVYRMAEMQGIAFQLTNIMRDVSEDCAMQRCYLPSQLLDRFGVTSEDIAEKRDTPGMRQLYNHMSALIDSYYHHCSALPRYIDPESRACLRAMTMIYRGIAKKLAKLGPQALQRRVRLSTPQKFACVFWACFFSGFELFISHMQQLWQYFFQSNDTN